MGRGLEWRYTSVIHVEKRREKGIRTRPVGDEDTERETKQ